MSGCIARTTFEKFLKNFSKDFNLKDFRFVSVSDDVTIDAKLKDIVLSSPSLLPPSICTSIYIDGEKVTEEYIEYYKKHLKKPLPLGTINALVTLATRGEKILMLCSKEEKQYKYLEIIGEFIDETYGVKMYTYDELKEAVSKSTEWVKDLYVINKKIEEVEKYIYYETDGKDEKEKMERRMLKEKLKTYSREELISLCSEKEIRLDIDMDKKDIIKTIIDVIEKGKKRGG